MRQTVTVPVIGDTTKFALIARWLVNVGDVVEEGQSLVEVEADKANVEIPSPVAGTVVEILAEPDDEVEIGGDLAVVETA